MKMHNPPHPGEVIKGLWLDPANITITTASQALGVSRKTLSKIVNGHGSITSEMAVRLSITFGGSPESWMRHQAVTMNFAKAMNWQPYDKLCDIFGRLMSFGCYC